MPLVLGLNSIHPDSAAVLADERGIIAAIAEERINRLKHCAVFPKNAIQEVLKIAGARIEDVTDIAIARDGSANRNAKLMFIAKNPRVGFSLARTRMKLHKEAGESLAAQMGYQESQLKANMHAVEHHVAHIASSYFCSSFDRATGVSVDGSGDFCTVMIALCEGNQIKVLKRCHPPHSLGFFYTAMCGFLGFTKYGEEYKVMGLAAYGQPEFLEKIRPICTWDAKNGVRLDQQCIINYTTMNDTLSDVDVQRSGHVQNGEIIVPRMWGDRLVEMFGPARERGTPITQREKNMAASLQARFEECYLQMLKDASSMTGLRDFVLAGGCALNGVANGKAVMQGLMDRVYIHPAAGDDGTAAGAALYVLHNKLGVPRAPEMKRAYLGPEYTDEQIKPATESAAGKGLKFVKLDRQRVLEHAVDSLMRGKIMGWFQGREEWGPRALGNRSIICNPNWPDMKAILNARIKNREAFRPFAPAVLFERLSDCYEGAHEVPFMNIVYKTKPEWRQRLSAVTHEDNTGRVQSVKREQNEMYYDLIKAFSERSGVPVLLNTSFNENEPIVHTPEQAIACFARTKMDCLAVGNYWCEKPTEIAAKAEVIAAEA
jgi:carbamoyltransferase